MESFSNSIFDSPLWSNDKPLGLSIGGENFDNYIHCFDTIEKQLKTSPINNYFYELAIKKFKAIDQENPVLWPIDLYKKIDYFSDFPQQILMISGLKKNYQTYLKTLK